MGPFPGGDVASDPSTGTQRCQKSYNSHKPLLQYALVIDAGSTGSRIHVYRYNNCGPTPDLEEETFEQTEKRPGGSGLSSYENEPEAAARSLDPLMKVAMDKVPDKVKSCTPIIVKATAGLRKIGEEKSNKILSAVRHRLETAYPFPVVSADKGGVEVMDGKYEGVYAWITTNYLLGKLGGPDKTPTVAVLDLGGGSTQIVFEPTFPDAPKGGLPEKLKEGDHKYELNFGGRDFTLYQHSYLGYGLMEARNHLHSLILKEAYEEYRKEGKKFDPSTTKPVNPCIAPGMTKEVTVNLGSGHPLGENVKISMTGPAEGAPAQCRRYAEQALQKDVECKLAPCAFNGVHQPSISRTFAREDVYLLSFFYDRTEALGMPSSFSLSELKDLTRKVCAGEKAWGVFSGIMDAVKELRDRPEWCLDLNFMLALVHTGYQMPIDREVNIAKKMKNYELGWALGARYGLAAPCLLYLTLTPVSSLPLLSQESGWQCKIRNVGR